MADARNERVYRFEPLDGSGIFLGLGPVECTLTGVAITVAVACVTAGIALPIALLAVMAGVGASIGRLGGRRIWEWTPLATHWLWLALTGRRRWVARLPLLPSEESQPPPLPPCLAGLEVVEVAWKGQLGLGAIHDRHRKTLTALVPVAGVAFVTKPREEQDRLVAGWGDLLAQYAASGSRVTSVFWSELTRPSSLDEHRAWFQTRQTDASRTSSPHDSYRELLDGRGSVVSHEIVVGLTVDAGSDRPNRGSRELLGQALSSSVDTLLRALRDAELGAGDPLGTVGLHRLLRDRIDPTSGPDNVGGGLTERLGLVTPASSGPLIVNCAWRNIRADGAWHRTWWVATWPRLAVAPSWLEGFLSDGAVTRTMTVAFTPVPVHQSKRRIDRDLIKLASDASTKEDKGRRVDAVHERSTEALLNREREIVSGYPEMGYTGLVTVSARTEEELDEHSQIVEQLARSAGMELRLLDGRQDAAWAAALPLGITPRVSVTA